MNQKSALVCGAGGFIGSHLVKRLKREGFWVRGVDLKFPEFSETHADDFILTDLRESANCRDVVDRRFTEVYQGRTSLPVRALMTSSTLRPSASPRSPMSSLPPARQAAIR